jgi:uncharacterized protein DUF6907
MAIWQEDPCPPWCVGSHGDGEHFDDRSHYSEDVEVSLTCEQALESRLLVLHVSLWQHYRESSPRVSLNRGDEIGVYLTLPEAEVLANALRDQVRRAGTRLAVVPQGEVSELDSPLKSAA